MRHTTPTQWALMRRPKHRCGVRLTLRPDTVTICYTRLVGETRIRVFRRIPLAALEAIPLWRAAIAQEIRNLRSVITEYIQPDNP